MTAARVWGGRRQQAALVVVLVAAVVAMLYVQWSPHGPALALRVEGPARVRLGQETSLRVMVGNPHARPVRLDDLDLAHAYLDGLMVMQVTPMARDVHWHRRLGILSLSYSEWLRPGELREWVVRLKAVKTGQFRGEVAAYSATNVTSRLLKTLVIP